MTAPAGSPPAAAAYLEGALASVQARPDDAGVHCDLGSALFDAGLAKLAVFHFEQAVALQPDWVEAHRKLVHALSKSFDGAPALAASNRLLALRGADAQAWATHARILNHGRRHEEALHACDRALSLQPDCVDAHVWKAVAHLARFEFVPGWRELEWRWQQDTPAPSRAPHAIGLPPWQGGKSGRRLLLHSVHGIGDDVRYASLFPQLASYPQKKTISIDDRLIPLFRRSFPDLEFTGPSDAAAQSLCEEQLLLGSLPRFFLGSIEEFRQRRLPFLRSDVPRRDRLRHRIKTVGRLLCGFSWASTHPVYGANKTLPLTQLAPILASAGVDFVELQYGDTRQDREALKSSHGVELIRVDEVDNFSNIDGLASLIDACDVVITTSNVTVHLAGALGKDTLLLAPFRGPMWCRQHLEGASLWYPTVRLFEQDRHGDWGNAIEAARRALHART